MVAEPENALTHLQHEQLEAFLEERNHTGEVDLRPAVSLGDGYLEAVLLDAGGDETTAKRILFP